MDKNTTGWLRFTVATLISLGVVVVVLNVRSSWRDQAESGIPQLNGQSEPASSVVDGNNRDRSPRGEAPIESESSHRAASSAEHGMAESSLPDATQGGEDHLAERITELQLLVGELKFQAPGASWRRARALYLLIVETPGGADGFALLLNSAQDQELRTLLQLILFDCRDAECNNLGSSFDLQVPSQILAAIEAIALRGEPARAHATLEFIAFAELAPSPARDSLLNAGESVARQVIVSPVPGQERTFHLARRIFDRQGPNADPAVIDALAAIAVDGASPIAGSAIRGLQNHTADSAVTALTRAMEDARTREAALTAISYRYESTRFDSDPLELPFSDRARALLESPGDLPVKEVKAIIRAAAGMPTQALAYDLLDRVCRRDGPSPEITMACTLSSLIGNGASRDDVQRRYQELQMVAAGQGVWPRSDEKAR